MEETPCPASSLGLRSLGGRCCLPLCLEAGQVLPGPRLGGILRPGGQPACRSLLETWQIVISYCWRRGTSPGGKMSQWRNAARKRSGVGTESREDLARPVWPQPSGTPAPSPTPTLGEPRQVAEQRRGWPAGRVPASGPRAGQTGVAPSLTLPLERRPDRCEQPRYAGELRTAPRCNQQTLYLRDF